MELRWSALYTSRLLPQERFLVFSSVKGRIEAQAVVRQEGLGQLITPMTTSGIEPMTTRLVTKCRRQLGSRRA
jgi:hypothetical protein